MAGNDPIRPGSRSIELSSVSGPTMAPAPGLDKTKPAISQVQAELGSATASNVNIGSIAASLKQKVGIVDYIVGAFYLAFGGTETKHQIASLKLLGFTDREAARALSALSTASFDKQPVIDAGKSALNNLSGTDDLTKFKTYVKSISTSLSIPVDLPASLKGRVTSHAVNEGEGIASPKDDKLQNPSSIYKQALKALKQGQPARAVEMLSRLHKLYPGNAHYISDLARASMLGPKQTAALYMEAIQNGADDPMLSANLSHCLLQLAESSPAGSPQRAELLKQAKDVVDARCLLANERQETLSSSFLVEMLAVHAKADTLIGGSPSVETFVPAPPPRQRASTPRSAPIVLDPHQVTAGKELAKKMLSGMFKSTQLYRDDHSQNAFISDLSKIRSLHLMQLKEVSKLPAFKSDSDDSKNVRVAKEAVQSSLLAIGAASDKSLLKHSAALIQNILNLSEVADPKQREYYRKMAQGILNLHTYFASLETSGNTPASPILSNFTRQIPALQKSINPAKSHYAVTALNLFKDREIVKMGRELVDGLKRTYGQEKPLADLYSARLKDLYDPSKPHFRLPKNASEEVQQKKAAVLEALQKAANDPAHSLSLSLKAIESLVALAKSTENQALESDALMAAKEILYTQYYMAQVQIFHLSQKDITAIAPNDVVEFGQQIEHWRNLISSVATE